MTQRVVGVKIETGVVSTLVQFHADLVERSLYQYVVELPTDPLR